MGGEFTSSEANRTFEPALATEGLRESESSFINTVLQLGDTRSCARSKLFSTVSAQLPCNPLIFSVRSAANHHYLFLLSPFTIPAIADKP